jgi:hypothetical protein
MRAIRYHIIIPTRLPTFFDDNLFEEEEDVDPDGNYTKLLGCTSDEMAAWATLNIILIVFIVIKFMSLLRIFPKIGKLVKLLAQVLIDSIIFTCFFLGWIYIFSLIFQAAGIAIDGGDADEKSDYQNLSITWKYLLYVYRNSIGDINAP